MSLTAFHRLHGDCAVVLRDFPVRRTDFRRRHVVNPAPELVRHCRHCRSKDQAADLWSDSWKRGKDLSMTQLQAEISEDYKIERSEDYLQISDANGNLIYRSRFLEEHPLPPLSLDELHRPRYENRRLGPQAAFRLISEQIDHKWSRVPGSDRAPYAAEIETLDDFGKYLLWLCAHFSCWGHQVWAIGLSRRALAPVDALARTARTISGHNLSRRLERNC